MRGQGGGVRYGSAGSAIWGELEGSTEGDWLSARKLPAERGEGAWEAAERDRPRRRGSRAS